MDRKPMPTWTKIASLAMLALLLMMVAAGAERASEAKAREAVRQMAAPAAPPAPAPAPRPVDPVRVTNEALWRAYDANEVAADNLYRDKSLLVEGDVRRVSKNAFDQVVLDLAGPNPYVHTVAGLDPSQAGEAAQLRRGNGVRLLCVGGGKMLGAPMLLNCTIKAVRR